MKSSLFNFLSGLVNSIDLPSMTAFILSPSTVYVPAYSSFCQNMVIVIYAFQPELNLSETITPSLHV